MSVLGATALLLVVGQPQAAHRAPIAVLVDLAESRTVEVSPVLRAVDRLLSKNTGYRRTSIAPGLWDTCQGRLACVALRVDPDADQPRRKAAERPRFALVLSTLKSEEGSYLKVFLLNIETALERYRKAERKEGWRAKLQVELLDEAIEFVLEPQLVRSPKELFERLERVFEGPLQRVFEAEHQWRPFGQVVLEGTLAGAEVQLGDGLYSSSERRLPISDLAPGQYPLVVRTGDARCRTTVSVQRGRLTRVQLDSLCPRTEASALDLASLYGGVSLAVAGAVLAVVGLAQASVIRSGGCVVQPGTEDVSGCGERGFPSVTEWRRPQSRFDQPSVRTSALSFLPLGYSMAIAGGAMLGAHWLFKAHPRWVKVLTVVSSLALFGVSYGLSVGLGG